MNFRGDTYNIANMLKIPNIALFPIALLDSYALYHWENYWYDRRGRKKGETRLVDLPVIRFKVADYSF